MDGYQFIDSASIAWRKSTFADGVQAKDLGSFDPTGIPVRATAGAGMS